MPKLGVNIDHVATLRQARGGGRPSPLEAALEAQKGGADGITVHLREDRRHIQDHDLWQLKKKIRVPLNLEMALHPEIVRIAMRLLPEKACIVPEKRREVTTEGGLDAFQKRKVLKRVVPSLQRKGIEVSLFIDPEIRQVRTAKEVGAKAIELHTGTYANAKGEKRKKELLRLRKSAIEAHKLGLKVHAGHGLDYENVLPIAKIPYMKELNIGHSIVACAVSVGIRKAVQEMRKKMRS
ncbi:MAG: pyridoxine 5'-phosphate synthase [Candidatus Omnitrophica bacterium]|nr:pyridoxine 5'-phosphate synthase [Candidatus Omnitrophota bacterium]